MPSRGHLHQRCGDGYQTDLRPKEVSRLSMTRRNSGCGGAGYRRPILSPTSPPAECFIFDHDAGTAVPLMRQYGCSACHFVLCRCIGSFGPLRFCLLPEKFWLCVSLSFYSLGLGLASSGGRVCGCDVCGLMSMSPSMRDARTSIFRHFARTLPRPSGSSVRPSGS